MASPYSSPTYKLGLALSGGGARGFAHAGVLKALEEADMVPDVIAGVSAGSIAGVLYASGLKPEEILELFAHLKFTDLCRLHLSNGGILDMGRFRQFLMKALKGKDRLEDLDIPMYIGATDFDNGVPAVFSSGSIAERVAASCSIPIAFSPVRIDGVNYVDGGVLRNLPAWTIRDKCIHLIGVDCSPLGNEKFSSRSMLDIAFRSFRLIAKSTVPYDRQLCDLVIDTPDIAHYRTFNLKDIRKCYQSGYDSARRALDNICWLSPSQGVTNQRNLNSDK